MHPYILEAVAKERIADMHAVAAAHRLAREAAAGRGRAARKHRAISAMASRRHRKVELVWPDGVTTVVELSQQSSLADGERHGLAGSRR
jgi:hypothetical protein